MNEKIIEEIKKEQEKAVQKFESAKAEAIESLKNMQIHTAVDFGAGYAAHIDKVTAAAAEARKCAEILVMINYCTRNN